MAKKLTKDDLRSPDEVWRASKKAYDFFQSQWVVLVVAVALLLAGTVGGIYYYQMKKSHEAKASYHFGLAKSYLEQWRLGAEAEKTASLDKLNNELSILSKDFAGTQAAGMANLVRAEMAAEEGKQPVAIQFYAEFAASLPARNSDLAYYPMGVLQEGAGEMEAALASFSKVLEVKGSSYRKYALMAKARVLRSLNRYQEAAGTYQTYLDEFSSSADVGKVRGLLSLTQSLQAAQQ